MTLRERATRWLTRVQHASTTPKIPGTTSDDVLALQQEVLLAREERAALRSELSALRAELLVALRVVMDDEANVRRLLAAERAASDYEDAWNDPDPLISVVVPTYRAWKLLEKRALPSILAQTHGNIEVLVVGDGAPPETAEAIRRVDDSRVRYENLAIRGPYPEDPRRRWLVAGTGPLNRGLRRARGSWISIFNDDDAMRPEHLELLLEEARRSRAEVAYSKLVQHAPDGAQTVLGSFPPATHAFGWQLALQHRALRIFEYELQAELFDEPGDWHRARRMLRAGVEFSQTDVVSVDYYPSLLWDAPAPSADSAIGRP